MYKLIAIDLDGTLLNQYGEVSNENKEVLLRAKDKGVEVVIASGRNTESIENIAREIGADNYCIAGNGALVYDMKNCEILYNRYLEKQKVLDIVKICDENSIYYSIYTDKEIIAKSFNFNVLYYYSENTKKNVEKRTNINLVQDIYGYVSNLENQNFLKITICDSHRSVFESIIKKFKKIDGIEVLEVEHMSRKTIKQGTEEVAIEYFYTEITNKNVDKWNAIKFLIERLGIEPTEVIAFGDNLNDKMMIEEAGLGITLEGSNPNIVEIADFVTKDNNSNSIEYALNKFI